MRFPTRLAHLATVKVVAAKLAPAFALAHRVDEDEARDRLEHGLPGALLDDLLEATWLELQAQSKRFDEARALEKIAETLKDRPLRPGRAAEVSAELAAFYVLVDVAAGTASEAARRLMETDAGRAKGELGMASAARQLARELTRGA